MAPTGLAHLPNDWRDALAPAESELVRAHAVVGSERAAGTPIEPPAADVWRAFSLPVAQVRVVIVGQDPYPTPGDAMGLAFSVPAGRALPRTLRNIARELRADTGDALGTGDLSHWEAQGVLLLNRVLTVRAGAAGSHRGIGWEEVTARALEALAARDVPLVAVLWGRDAQAAAVHLPGVEIIESAHPSPLSATRGFFGSRPFSRVNDYLASKGAATINWAAPSDLATQLF